MDEYLSIGIGWAIFLASEACAVQMIRKLKELKFYNPKDLKPMWYTPHSVVNAVCMLIICGHGMVIFRLLPGLKTSLLKLIHMAIFTFVILTHLWSQSYINDVMDHFNFKPENVSLLHSRLGRGIQYLFAFQYISGIFVFLYMYPNVHRMRFTNLHNFVGICFLGTTILNSCIITTANLYKARRSGVDTNHEANNLYCLFIGYGFLINAIVLNPFMEWPLVGGI